MGPVINERQFDRIQGYIQAGQTEGAKLLIGGVDVTLLRDLSKACLCSQQF